jgi:uncharacterized protein with NAD-binding domain and iron-sulfur cluster
MSPPGNGHGAAAERIKRVAIVGAGVGGLTAAHELAARGYQVTVYEKKEDGVVGGKARSVDNPLTGAGQQGPVPGEHGFRFFPAFYQHVFDTMKRIPLKQPGKTVLDNLVSTTECLFATYHNPPFALPFVFEAKWSNIRKWIGFLPGLLSLQAENGERLHASDLAFYASRLFRILTSCLERRIQEFDDTSWFQYLDANNRTSAFRKYLAIGLTRNLVACKAEKANTLTIGQIALQLMFSLFSPSRIDRVLNGPTNEAWLTPWREHLQNRDVFRHPVQFVFNHELEEIHWDANTRRVTALAMKQSSRLRDEVRDAVNQAVNAATVKFGQARGPVDFWKRNTELAKVATEARLKAEARLLKQPEQLKRVVVDDADHYVLALPVEQMAGYVTDALATFDPKLAHIRELRNNVDWMVGIQYYLTQDPPLPMGHVDYLDSEWALTSITQDDSLWTNKLNKFGDGSVKHILSVDISDWAAKGSFAARGQSAWDSPPHHIAKEVWDQLKKSLNRPGAVVLDDSMIHPIYRWFLDDNIDERRDIRKVQTLRVSPSPELHSASGHPAEAPLLTNAEPLLVNYVGTHAKRPTAETLLRNMYLASDYVDTYTGLATMEAANEAARRAVNGILKEDQATRDFCRVFPLKEPLRLLRLIDRYAFKAGREWPWWGLETPFRMGAYAVVRGAQVLERLVRAGEKLIGHQPQSTLVPTVSPGQTVPAEGRPGSVSAPGSGSGSGASRWKIAATSPLYQGVSRPEGSVP